MEVLEVMEVLEALEGSRSIKGQNSDNYPHNTKHCSVLTHLHHSPSHRQIVAGRPSVLENLEGGILN